MHAKNMCSTVCHQLAQVTCIVQGSNVSHSALFQIFYQFLCQYQQKIYPEQFPCSISNMLSTLVSDINLC